MTPDKRNGSAIDGGAERDPRLDRAYRAGAREEPPAHVDAAILATAHREAGARPRPLSARLHAWRVPASIAAVVVLSVSVVTLVREEGGDRLNTSTAMVSRSAKTAPAPQAAPEAARSKDEAQREAPEVSAAQGRAKLERDDTAVSVAGAKAAEEARQRDATARRAEDAPRRAAQSAAAAPAGPEAQPPAPRPFSDAASMREQRPAAPYAGSAAGASARSSMGIRGSSGEMESSVAPTEPPAAAGSSTGALSLDRAPRPATAARPATNMESRGLKAEQAKRADSGRIALLVKELEGRPAQKWLEKIEALRRDGRKDEADDLLAEFKRRFPDYPLPSASGNP